MVSPAPGTRPPVVLDDEARARLAGVCEPFALSAGEVLFRQGAKADAAYFVSHGRLEIATRIPGDETAVVSDIRAGEVVGEFALLDDRPRSANVRAVEPAAGLRLSRLRFAGLLADGWPPALVLIEALCRLVAGRISASLGRIAEARRYERSSLRQPGAVAAAKGDAGGDLGEYLAALPRLADLAGQAEALAALGDWREVPRGGRLAGPGDDCAGLRLVLRGALRTAIPRPEGLEQIAIHGPGELAGLVPLLAGGAEPLLIEAAEDTLLFVIDRSGFEMLRAGQSPLASALLACAGRQLVRDQIRANRHLGRIAALVSFNAAGGTADV